MKAGLLKRLLEHVNDDVEIVGKNFLLAGEVTHFQDILSVVEDDGSIPAALIVSHRTQESIMASEQRNHFPVWVQERFVP